MDAILILICVVSLISLVRFWIRLFCKVARQADRMSARLSRTYRIRI